MAIFSIQIATPQELLDERTKLIDDILVIINQQARSNTRYALRMLNKRNKLRAVEKKLGN